MLSDFKKEWEEKLKRIEKDAARNNFHYSCVFWESPFKKLEVRVGCFYDYFEARMFADYLFHEYEKGGMEFKVLIDGEFYKC